jgi:hypothetical protein
MENEKADATRDIPENHIVESNLVFKIWTHPKQTLDYILKNCPGKNLTILFILAGISRAIDRAVSHHNGDKMSTVAVLTVAILGGGLLGWISYFFYAWLLSVTGKWIKGNATSENFRTILAWASIPLIASLLLLIPELMLVGGDIFRSEMAEISFPVSIVLMIFWYIEISLAIWGLIILVEGISLVQNFKTGKAILNAVLPVLLIMIPVMLLVFGIKLFN